MPAEVASRYQPAVEITADERATLEGWVRRLTTAQALSLRARIVLACAGAKKANGEIARDLKIERQTVGKWRARFLKKRVDGLLDEARPGAPRKITDAHVERVIAKTLESTPRDATHWSTRSMAKATGL